MEPEMCFYQWVARARGERTGSMIRGQGQNHSTAVSTSTLIRAHHVHSAYHSMHTQREEHCRSQARLSCTIHSIMAHTAIAFPYAPVAIPNILSLEVLGLAKLFCTGWKAQGNPKQGTPHQASAAAPPLLFLLFPRRLGGWVQGPGSGGMGVEIEEGGKQLADSLRHATRHCTGRHRDRDRH
eukprot:660846-Rhodomonas_salina.1